MFTNNHSLTQPTSVDVWRGSKHTHTHTHTHHTHTHTHTHHTHHTHTNHEVDWRQKPEMQKFWQQAKHGMLYSDPYQAWQRVSFTVLYSQQKGLNFCVCGALLCGKVGRLYSVTTKTVSLSTVVQQESLKIMHESLKRIIALGQNSIQSNPRQWQLSPT